MKLLMIFLDENDRYGDLPLYEAIVRRLAKLEISGATVISGIMGFGAGQKIHHKGLFGVSDDKPITILVADQEPRLRNAAPSLRQIAPEALLLMLDAAPL